MSSLSDYNPDYLRVIEAAEKGDDDTVIDLLAPYTVRAHAGIIRTAVAYGKGMEHADTAFRLAERMDTLQADVTAVVEFIRNLEQAIAASPLAAMMGAPAAPPDIVVPSPSGQLPPGYRPPPFR